MKEKIDFIYKKFAECKNERDFYLTIMEFSKIAKKFPKELILKENLVKGCQSKLYLTHTYIDGKIELFVLSDSQFTLGLAAIIEFLYSGEDSKKVFTDPPHFLSDLKLLEKISMNRQIGFNNLFKKVQLICSNYI